MSRTTPEKILKNKNLAKGNNSCKGRLIVIKLKLDLYYAMTNSYAIFQVNISKDGRKKSGN